MITRFKLIFLALIILCGSGCSSLPFKNIDYVSLDGLNPNALRQEFQEQLAQNLEIINSIVFQYKWQSFSALGYTQIDLKSDTFRVSCLSPVGIKLFELTGDRQEVKPIFVLKELLQRGDLPRAVGEDIRRIYFDFTPLPVAKIESEKYKITFTQPSGKGELQYVFAGKNHWLVEKHYLEKKHKLWSVYYYDYELHNGKLYPTNLILKHHRFGYNLIIRLKEVP